MIPLEVTKHVSVFEINDGAIHWVAATSKKDAIDVFLSVYGWTEVAWKRAIGGEPEVEKYTKDSLTVTLWDESLPDGYPEGCSLQVEIPSSAFSKLGRGIIATTEY